MARIFLLGPSEWESDKTDRSLDDPMQIRREPAKIFKQDHHDVILMEDEHNVRIPAMVDTQTAHAGQLRSEATLDLLKLN